MRGKNKSLLEDIIIISVIGIVIFGVYTLFFQTEETNETTNSPQVVEKTIIEQTEKPNTLNKPEETVINEIKRNEEIKKQEEPQKTNINTSSNIVEEKIAQKEPEKQVVKPVIAQTEKITPKDSETQTLSQAQELDEKAKIELFYKGIRDKIYLNLEKNLDKTSLKSNEFVNIRLTILKSGKAEQLILLEGNNEYFELIKPSINQAFPVNIDESLKQSFPRYFRMKIEFK